MIALVTIAVGATVFWWLGRPKPVPVQVKEIDRGISGERLTTRGFGESRPITENNTEEGRFKNRRVDFIILGGDGRIANVDLNGYDLTVRRSLSTHAVSTNSVIFSAAPATLTVDQTINTTYGGSFAGAVSLVKRGAGTLTLTNELDRSTTTSGGVTG